MQSQIDIDVILVVIAIIIELAVLGALMFGVLIDNKKQTNVNLISSKVELTLDATKQSKENAYLQLKQSILEELEKNNLIQINEVNANSANLKTITASILIVNN